MTDLLAQNKCLEQWLTATISGLVESNGKMFSYTGNFIDFEDRVILDEVPRTEYSEGGVYFFGTSNMKWAFQTWDLPATQRRLVHDYGIGASNHFGQLRFIQYLIKYRRFLTVGERDLVVLGVSFHDAGGDVDDWGFFRPVLRRWGLFTVTTEGAIAPVPMSGIERWLRIEKARSTGFIWNLGRLAHNWTLAFFGWGRPPPHDPANYQQFWREIMGPQWRQNLDSQLEWLREAVELVRSRHAEVTVMLLPQATWMDGMPFKSAYEAKVRTLCQRTSTPLIDFSRAIPDQEFVDSNHLGPEGQEQFRGLVMSQILPQLRRIEKTKRLSNRGSPQPGCGDGPVDPGWASQLCDPDRRPRRRGIGPARRQRGQAGS